MRLGQILCIISFGFTAAACGNPDPTTLSASENSCQANTALIRIEDTALSRRCGCSEAAQQFNAPSSALTCTVKAGTTVFFDAQATLLDHQVLSTGNPSFASGPLFRGKKDPRSYAVTLSTPGTYSFEDPFQPGLSGQIVVQ